MIMVRFCKLEQMQEHLPLLAETMRDLPGCMSTRKGEAVHCHNKEEVVSVIVHRPCTLHQALEGAHNDDICEQAHQQVGSTSAYKGGY